MSRDEDQDRWEDLEAEARSSAPEISGAMSDLPVSDEQQREPEEPDLTHRSPAPDTRSPRSHHRRLIAVGCVVIAALTLIAMAVFLLGPMLGNLPAE